MCGGKVALPPIVKEKRRNSEKRKEKSRDAARCRRSKESEIFQDLSRELPVPQAVTSNLDKASVMRLTLACLKVKDMITILGPKELSHTPLDECYREALNGFLLVLSEEGDVLFISEKVEQILGTHYADMMGNPMFDYLHPCDHEELQSLLTTQEDPRGGAISLFLRIKSALKNTKDRRTLHLKSNSYQVIHCVGHKFKKPLSDVESRRSFYLLFIGTPIPHPAHVEVPLSNKDVFLSRHTPDMKFTHCDDKISDFLGFKSSDLLGKSVYAFHHALDAEALLASYKTLLSKGQVETGYYRFVCKHGGHVWLVTQATLICDNSSQRPECVVCLNYVLSKVEHGEEIVSEQQEQQQQQPKQQQQQQEVADISNTCVIFKRKDMSKQFLNFPDTDILLFHEPLKADSKQLHLDLDLFPDDGIEDPFSYREDSLSSPSYCGTPESSMHLPLSTGTSPDRFNCSSRSPDTPDSGSLSDIPSLDPIDTFSNLRFNMPPASDKEECYEEDLDFRAPFIPMQMDDDFPLLSPSNSVMWGPPQETPPRKSSTPQERISEVEPQRAPPSKQLQQPKHSLNENSLKSSLAALLQSDTTKKTTNNSNNRHNDRNNRRWHNADNKTPRQRNFANSRSYSSGGHIIMLDSVPPVKKQPQPKQQPPSSSSQRRANSSPSIGSHTSTMRVNDRLIKVQVSVSELPSSALPIEQKQPFPSPPDPPPKRASPPAAATDSPKRIKVDNNSNNLFTQGSTASDSVLLNLLISGEDASRGYLCSGNSRYAENKQQFEPAVLSLPAHDRLDLSESADLLSTESSDLLDSYLKVQYDAGLHSDELLDALDHPLLRNVSAALG